MGFIEELNNIDINDFGSSSRRVKIFATCLLGVALFIGVYYFVIKKQQVELEKVEKQEQTLRNTFLEKK